MRVSHKADIAPGDLDGHTVEITRRFETFARLAVTDPATPERSCKVEFAANWRPHPPVTMDVGPVPHVDEVVTGKMSALFTRARRRVRPRRR